jgi:hypothetical protein
MFRRAYFTLAVALAASAASGQEFSGPSFAFKCPEKNGFFADPEQCDLYYICEDNVARAQLCPDGLLFDDTIRNREKCVLPHNVDCGNREFQQEPQAGIDPRCERANGIFDHEDPAVCSKFYTCDNGTAFEMPCAAPLVFDSTIGSCVRDEQKSDKAKRCDGSKSGELKTIEGFTCPGSSEIGPNGLLQEHPVYPHPADCQYFFTCFYGKEPNKFGCSSGQVFDALSLTCKSSEEVADCKCWYDCGKNSKCPGECNADCTCPSDAGSHSSVAGGRNPAPAADVSLEDD